MVQWLKCMKYCHMLIFRHWPEIRLSQLIVLTKGLLDNHVLDSGFIIQTFQHVLINVCKLFGLLWCRSIKKKKKSCLIFGLLFLEIIKCLTLLYCLTFSTLQVIKSRCSNHFRGHRCKCLSWLLLETFVKEWAMVFGIIMRTWIWGRGL